MRDISDIKRRNTKQKQIIIEFLKENKDRHLTADEIVDNLKIDNLKVSKATVYRLLNSLSEDGLLRKYVLSENLCSCYQYVENSSECNKHYHLICYECGNVEHFDDENIIKLQENVLKNHKFKLDLQRVIFYGSCKSCIKKRSK